jgi:tetratricopeptide (TPR) repeat protein
MKPALKAGFGAVVIVAAGLWVYGPALRGGWLWDDSMYFGNNPLLPLPAGAALRAIWSGAADVSYFPLTALARWAEWHLWGENTLGYHLTNLALHLVSALLFWRLLRQWRAETGDGAGPGAAWLGALLFAVHPVAVESVAWISELKNTLSLPPLLLSLSAYLAFDRAPGRGTGPYGRSLLWFLIALLCKSTVVMLPACLLLHAWWKRGRIGRRDLVASAPFFALALALGLVAVWFEHHAVLDYRLVPVESFSTRLGGAGVALVFYLGKAIFPVGLTPIYPQWRLTACAPFLAGLALASVVGWLLSRRARAGRDALFGLGWFILCLAPMVGLIGLAYLRISRVADHFAYLALLGVIGWGTLALDRWRRQGGAARRVVAWLGAAAAAAALALEARACAGFYRNETVFWRETLRRNPEAWLAHYDLGNILLAEDRLPEALGHYQEAARLNPRQSEPQANWGVVLVMLGRSAEAVPHLEAAVRLDPENALQENSLGMALVNIGQFEPAVVHYERALALDPALAEARNNLGRVFGLQGRQDEAIVQYRAAVRLRPRSAVMRRNLAQALSQAGRLDEALDEYAEASRLEHPDVTP